MTHNCAERSRDDRLNDVLLTYVEACEAGEEPPREELLAAHPDLRDDLVAFFASHDEVERLTAPLRAAGKPDEAADTSAGAAIGLGRLGDFRLIREVGRGGMGVVYEAEQISLRRRVALKILPFAAAVDPRQLQRFKNEATAAAHLHHENIVPVFAVGCERGVHYYAMQFIDGQSLAALVTELRQVQETRNSKHEIRNEEEDGAEHDTVRAQHDATARASPFSDFDFRASNFPTWVANLGRQAALALEHAHQTGVVHRDVKPGNLLLDPQGHLWVTDFGLAQVTGDSGLTMTGELLGTLRYASPEQALGRRGVVDHRSDVYSLGATLYELLTLGPPFDGRDRHELLRQIAEDTPPSPRAINPAIPAALETIVLKALRKEPADRYATAQELADDLQRFLNRQPVLARRPGSAERFRMWTRRHPFAIVVSAAGLLLVTAGSLVAAALVGAEQERTLTEQRRAEEAYRRERQRAEEAEARLALARRAVDELFRASEEELADRPGTEMLRKRFLRSALAYYQEFLAERRDDPGAQTELLETTRRVEKILADLAALRTATLFYLLLQPAVLDDLELSPEQRGRMRVLTARVGKEWSESFRDIGLAAPAERRRRVVAQARVNEVELNTILTPGQQVRLRQIGLQSEGSSAFRDPEVALALGLTPGQRERIRVIEDDAVFGWMRTMARGNPTSDAGQAREIDTRSVNERILALLSESQLRKWRELTGPPVKGPISAFPGPIAPPPPKKDTKRGGKGTP